MRPASTLIQELKQGLYLKRFGEVYMDHALDKYQTERYIKAVEEYERIFGDDDVAVYSAPGRSEIGGNHTDHQCGKVFATSVNIDTIAVTAKREDDIVCLKSEGYEQIEINLKEIEKREDEQGTTTALIRGVAAGVKLKGFQIGGFNAYVTSEVLSGSGLSSSAAFEILIGTIFSYLYNEGKIDAQEIAKIGQYAENVYFGKPCGLMDQMACSVGGLIYIDFGEMEQPVVKSVDVAFEHFKHSLCIVDTKGSHADLTDEYAAIPAEMKKVAAVYGEDILKQIDESRFYQDIPELRQKCGDRAVLRAIHWFEENKRVEKEMDALISGNFEQFLFQVKASGNSSAKYLQNIYSNKKVDEQSITIGLAVSDVILSGKGASRIHGGGFAGTMQSFVPDALVEQYKEKMEKVFGKGSCQILKVRKFGGIRVI